jgi:uncharacterized membrane protein (GlpM family)
MLLILKAVLAGILTACVVLLANAGSHRVAGLLISFPVVLMTSVFVIGNTAGQDVAMSVVKNNIFALPVWMITVGAIVITLRYLPLPVALASSLCVWLLAALTFMWITE